MSLPDFDSVEIHHEPLADGFAREAQWMGRAAASDTAEAHLWHGEPGFAVPRSYTMLPSWRAVARQHSVQPRASGGGIVPQGPGVLNLSLVWRAARGPGDIEAVYRALCRELAGALARIGIHATPQAVNGSFCDGRFNLAVADRKLVGTAQSWRHIHGQKVVLAHAMIVVDADPLALTAAANAFERELGSERRYRADALTSIAQNWPDAHCAAPPADLWAQMNRLLAGQFAGAPGAHRNLVNPFKQHGNPQEGKT